MTTTGLRARQREFAAAELQRTALAMFAERGFTAVSVDEIVAAAGTSQRTFFRHFAGKDDLLLRYEQRIHERFLAALRERPATEGPVTALRNAYVATSTVAPADLPDVVTRARVVADSPVLGARARGERMARTGDIAGILAQRAGAKHAGEHHRVIAAAMGAVAQTAWDSWLTDDARSNPAERIAAALDLLVAGLHALDGDIRPAARARTKGPRPESTPTKERSR